MKNIKTFITQDGSLGLYNTELDEIYHSKFGAKKEAFEKFVEPCLILDNKPLKILDICYGIGYNTKCAIENFKNIKLIDCVEKDEELVKKSPQFEYDKKINDIIENNLKNPEFIHFYTDDIRKIINISDKKYDIIFHDGFAPHKQPELWSVELISKILQKLDKNGLYCTYNHSKPVLRALFENKIYIGKVIKDNRTIATTASFNPELIENPLSDIDIKELETKSAIPYHDWNLKLSSQEIINLRKEEVKNSKLQTLSSLKKQK